MSVGVDVVGVGSACGVLPQRLRSRVCVEEYGTGLLRLDTSSETVVGIVALDYAVVSDRQKVTGNISEVGPLTAGNILGSEVLVPVVAVGSRGGTVHCVSSLLVML